jgi:transposase-like protein
MFKAQGYCPFCKKNTEVEIRPDYRFTSRKCTECGKSWGYKSNPHLENRQRDNRR